MRLQTVHSLPRLWTQHYACMHFLVIAMNYLVNWLCVSLLFLHISVRVNFHSITSFWSLLTYSWSNRRSVLWREETEQSTWESHDHPRLNGKPSAPQKPPFATLELTSAGLSDMLWGNSAALNTLSAWTRHFRTFHDSSPDYVDYSRQRNASMVSFGFSPWIYRLIGELCNV